MASTDMEIGPRSRKAETLSACSISFITQGLFEGNDYETQTQT